MAKTSTSFSVDAATLSQALTRANSVVSLGGGSNAKSFFIQAAKATLYLIAATADTFIKIRIPNADIQAEGQFVIDYEDLLGVVKSRGVMEFDHDGMVCNYKQVKGRYNGHLVTPAMTEDQRRTLTEFEAKLKASANAKLDKSVLSALKDGLRYTSIKDVYTGQALLAYLTLSKGNLSVTSFDSFHFSIYESKVDDSLDFRIALPTSHFAVIDKLVQEDAAAKFAVSSTDIKVESKDFRMILPSSQVDEKRFGLVPAFLKSLGKPTFAAEYDHADLSRTVDNLCTLNSSAAKMRFSHKVGKKTVQVEFSTQKGSAKDELPVTAKIDKAFDNPIDPLVMQNSVGILKGVKASCQLRVYDDRAICMKAVLENEATVTVINSFSE